MTENSVSRPLAFSPRFCQTNDRLDGWDAEVMITGRSPMKPAPFAYHAPSSVADALDAISRADDPEDLKVLAGGQSLVPILNLRLAQPGTLLDINGLEWEWGNIELDPAAVRMG